MVSTNTTMTGSTAASPAGQLLASALSTRPTWEVLGAECFKAVIFQLVPLEMLYFAIYFYLKQRYGLFKFLIFASLAAFWLEPWVTPINCGIGKSLQRFSISIGTMKVLDIFARRNAFFRWAAAGPPPPSWLQAFYLVIELRYESFKPNPIRISKQTFHEPTQLGIHLAMFGVLQALPQDWNTVLAFEVLLAIYVLWTTMQLIVRYESSPALFGPLYLADSLTGFWSVTWHNAFASPCNSLAYTPIRYILPRFGVSLPAARSFGVLGAFTLMSLFHVYALAPIVSNAGLVRVGLFFFLNGIATVFEAALWAHHQHWMRGVLAWTFETCLATWTVAGLGIPRGLWTVDWRDFC